MNARELICAQIERELAYQQKYEVGTDEYNASLERIGNLEDKLAHLEKLANEKKDLRNKNIIEIAKAILSSVITVGGIVYITANEKEITYTGALRGLINCIFPKR